MSWTHRVVKRMRGTQGEYFYLPTAETFDGEASAREYAERFAREQGEARVYGARMEVRARAGGWRGHRGAAVATYRSDDYITRSTTP